jgi:hypothetical protein
VPRYSPEQERQGNDKHRNQHANPNGPAQQELLHIWLADGECAEGGGFGLAEKHKDRIELILM